GLVRLSAERAGGRRVPHPGCLRSPGDLLHSQRSPLGQPRGVGSGGAPGRALSRAAALPRDRTRAGRSAAAGADPMTLTRACLVLLACAAAAPRAAGAGEAAGSVLAPRLLEGTERPELILAQRVIERSWGLSEDSTYVELSIPDWKSEGWAFLLSGAVP